MLDSWGHKEYTGLSDRTELNIAGLKELDECLKSRHKCQHNCSLQPVVGDTGEADVQHTVVVGAEMHRASFGKNGVACWFLGCLKSVARGGRMGPTFLACGKVSRQGKCTRIYLDVHYRNPK